MMEFAVRVAAGLCVASVLVLTVGSVLAICGAQTIADDMQPGDCPGCGAEADGGYHFDCCPAVAYGRAVFVTRPPEAAAMFEQSVADALWLSEVDELNRMWRA